MPEEGGEIYLNSLPKDHPDRKAVAKQVAEGRVLDRKGGWTADRDVMEYLEELGGIQSTLDYVRELQGPPIILDIGTGSSEAINKIKESSLGRGLEFRGTSLTHHPSVDKHLGRDKVSLTPVEQLRGIPDESIGGILAVRSMSYSALPEVAVRSVDRVLAPGGILKAVFRGEDFPNRSGENVADLFVSECAELGYDVARRVRMMGGMEESVVVVAIKAGARANKHSAAEIINEDRNRRSVIE